MEKFIPYAKQVITEEDIQEVVQVLRSDYLTTGPAIDKFEKAVAAQVGTKYAVAVANATAGLHLAVIALGIGKGDEVITTPISFVATSNAVLYSGAKVVFADVEKDTLNISAKSIAAKLTDRTKAIIAVHMAGNPCDMDSILEIADNKGISVIEDSAHAMGTLYHGRHVGSIGRMGVFSFHPVKNITAGEGGMITTDDEEIYKKLVMLRSHGVTRDKSKLSRTEAWWYEQQMLGFNYRMTDIQCALGNSQLSRIKDIKAKRQYIFEKYNNAFSKIANITTPKQTEDSSVCWHLYVARIAFDSIGMSREQFFAYMKDKGIGVNVHYIPIYWQPYYQELGYAKGLCETAEQQYEQIVSLPMWVGLEDSDIDYAIDCVKAIL